MTGLVLLEVREGIATLTLNDTARMNALSADLLGEANAAVEQVAQDPSARVLVVRAAGRAFSVGADLSTLQDAAAAPGAIDVLLRDFGNPLMRALHALPVPVLTVVQGAAAGGGVGLALGGDVVLAGRSAIFYQPFVPLLGLVPDMGAAWTLLRRLGTQRTTALGLLGDKLPAAQAAEWGLIHACVDDASLDDEAARLAARLAALPPQGIAEWRALIREAGSRAFSQQLEYERERQVACAAQASFDEGVRAFLEKRAPSFPRARKDEA